MRVAQGHLFSVNLDVSAGLCKKAVDCLYATLDLGHASLGLGSLGGPMKFNEDQTEPKCVECLERARLSVLHDLAHCSLAYSSGSKALKSEVIKAQANGSWANGFQAEGAQFNGSWAHVSKAGGRGLMGHRYLIFPGLGGKGKGVLGHPLLHARVLPWPNL